MCLIGRFLVPYLVRLATAEETSCIRDTVEQVSGNENAVLLQSRRSRSAQPASALLETATDAGTAAGPESAQPARALLETAVDAGAEAGSESAQPARALLDTATDAGAEAGPESAQPARALLETATDAGTAAGPESVQLSQRILKGPGGEAAADAGAEARPESAQPMSALPEISVDAGAQARPESALPETAAEAGAEARPESAQPASAIQETAADAGTGATLKDAQPELPPPTAAAADVDVSAAAAADALAALGISEVDVSAEAKLDGALAASAIPENAAIDALSLAVGLVLGAEPTARLEDVRPEVALPATAAVLADAEGGAALHASAAAGKEGRLSVWPFHHQAADPHGDATAELLMADLLLQESQSLLTETTAFVERSRAGQRNITEMVNRTLGGGAEEVKEALGSANFLLLLLNVSVNLTQRGVGRLGQAILEIEALNKRMGARSLSVEAGSEPASRLRAAAESLETCLFYSMGLSTPETLNKTSISELVPVNADAAHVKAQQFERAAVAHLAAGPSPEALRRVLGSFAVLSRAGALTDMSAGYLHHAHDAIGYVTQAIDQLEAAHGDATALVADLVQCCAEGLELLAGRADITHPTSFLGDVGTLLSLFAGVVLFCGLGACGCVILCPSSVFLPDGVKRT